MPRIPKKVLDRYSKSIPGFQRVLKQAFDRDINEADTVLIIQDILADVLGFEKYLEITSEYAIRNTYCDLAIKTDDKIQYLIEVKAIGITLKDTHLRQAIDYAANHGAQWVVLTNAIQWELYRIRFERPITHELVFSFDFTALNPRKSEDQDMLFVLSKEGLTKAVREDYYERVQSVNRFVIAAIITSDPIVNAIRKDVRKLSTGLKVDSDEIIKIIRTEVLKRDVLEGDEAKKAGARLRKLEKPNRRTRQKKSEVLPLSSTGAPDTQSSEEVKHDS